jgi:hypothetical protein
MRPSLLVYLFVLCYVSEWCAILCDMCICVLGLVVVALPPVKTPFAVQLRNNKKQNKLRGLSPRANYTDRAIAACRRSLLPRFADRGVSRSQRGGSPTAVISVTRPKPPLFLSSSSSIVLTRLSGPRSRPTTSQKI